MSTLAVSGASAVASLVSSTLLFAASLGTPRANALKGGEHRVSAFASTHMNDARVDASPIQMAGPSLPEPPSLCADRSTILHPTTVMIQAVKLIATIAPLQSEHMSARATGYAPW